MQIHTRRFVLRDFTSADTPAFLEYHADPGSSQFYQSHEATREHLENLVSTFTKLGFDTITGKTVADNVRINRLAHWFGAETVQSNLIDGTLCWRLTRDRWQHRMSSLSSKDA